jgi:hypothetical protein
MKPVYNKWMPIPHEIHDELWDTLSAQFEPTIIKREPDGGVKWEQDIEPQRGELEGRKFRLRGWGSNRDFDDYGVEEYLEYKPNRRVSRVAQELVRIARELTAESTTSDGLKEYLRFTFDDVDPKAADFVNSICSEIDDLADRIRRNENLDLVVERESKDDDTEVKILMSDHEAMKAIREEMIEKLGKLGKKKKIKIDVD